MWRRLNSTGTFAAMIALAAPCAAQSVPFPVAQSTPNASIATFDERAAAVIAFNACGREHDYLSARAAMRGGDLSDQGENLTNLLAAKLEWIQRHGPNEACVGQMRRARQRNPGPEPLLCGKETSTEAIVDENTVNVQVSVSPGCMAHQVNESIMAMAKDAQMGSEGMICIESLKFSPKGDWDVNVRELVRLLYLAEPRPNSPSQRQASVLKPGTVDHMYEDLLAARGGPSDGSYSQVGDCSHPAGDELGSPEDFADRHAWYNELTTAIGDFFHWFFITLPLKAFASGVSSAGGLLAAPFMLAGGGDPFPLIAPHWDVRVPETENHRLMIETSRFLTNQDIIRRLENEGYGHVEDIKSEQVEVRDWLLQHTQQIAAHDFSEYNSRPYTRYSLEALLNLHDFTVVEADPTLKTAALILLDLSASKFAIESNRGRRIVPFRRLSDSDKGPPGNLYEMFSGADFEVARALVLYGQTQLLPAGVPLAGVGTLVNTATSGYRPPRPAVEAAVEPGRILSQTILNTSVEITSRSPAFTLSAGGLRSGPSLETLGFSRDVDRGIAMPTVIIPTSSGYTMGDLFRFEGVGAQHERSENLCVRGGFACGINPRLSAAFDCGVGVSAGAETLRFVNSAACSRGKPALPAPPPHFYLAMRVVDCDGRFCEHGRTWGLLEIVEAPLARAGSDPEFDKFRIDRGTALRGSLPDAAGRGTYFPTDGARIDYIMTEDRPEILAVNGVPTAYATRGDLIDADGLGHVTIKGNGAVRIDFSDWKQPKRSP